MKRLIPCIIGVLLVCFSLAAHGSEGVAIQRVITNTRSELGQLATSSKARDIADLMKKFDTQYQTWAGSCGAGENFDPEHANDACKAMADQMRETGIALYGKLAEYLPDVAARYEQGARSAGRIVQAKAVGQTPAALYKATMDGITKAPRLGSVSSGGDASPFDLELDAFLDPTEKMFVVLEKLVPDFGKQIPEAVRAGNAQVTMMKKAARARYLASQFQKARFVLESQREYGEIIFTATKAVSTLPQVLGIQYTGTRLSARPNQKVLEFYRKKSNADRSKTKVRKLGGFDQRS